MYILYLTTLWMLCTIVLNLRPAYHACLCRVVVCVLMWWNLHHTNSERLVYGLDQYCHHRKAPIHQTLYHQFKKLASMLAPCY